MQQAQYTATMIQFVLLQSILRSFQGVESFAPFTRSLPPDNQRRASHSSILFAEKKSFVPGLPNLFKEPEAPYGGSDESFTGSPAFLVQQTKRLIAADLGLFEASLLDDSKFQWISATNDRPLGKTEYLAAGRFFDMRAAFPDLDYRPHDFRIDEADPTTVRVTCRPTGTMRGELRLRSETLPPTGETMRCPPEAVSVTFDSVSGKVTKLCTGFCMDRLIGNTGGATGVLAASVIAGNRVSDWELYPPTQVIGRFFGRPVKQLPEATSFLAPFPETVMIQLAKGVLSANMGADDPTLLSSSFTYCTPSIGPVKKDEFLEKYAALEFEGVEPRFTHFRVDPYDPVRVWVDLLPSAPGYQGCPQAMSLAFDDEGFCVRATSGAVMDPSIGNGGGLGGREGYLAALGQGRVPLATTPLPRILGKVRARALEPLTGASGIFRDLDEPRIAVTPRPPTTKPDVDTPKPMSPLDKLAAFKPNPTLTIKRNPFETSTPPVKRPRPPAEPVTKSRPSFSLRPNPTLRIQKPKKPLPPKVEKAVVSKPTLLQNLSRSFQIIKPQTSPSPPPKKPLPPKVEKAVAASKKQPSLMENLSRSFPILKPPTASSPSTGITAVPKAASDRSQQRSATADAPDAKRLSAEEAKTARAQKLAAEQREAEARAAARKKKEAIARQAAALAAKEAEIEAKKAAILKDRAERSAEIERKRLAIEEEKVALAAAKEAEAEARKAAIARQRAEKELEAEQRKRDLEAQRLSVAAAREAAVAAKEKMKLQSLASRSSEAMKKKREAAAQRATALAEREAAAKKRKIDAEYRKAAQLEAKQAASEAKRKELAAKKAKADRQKAALASVKSVSSRSTIPLFGFGKQNSENLGTSSIPLKKPPRPVRKKMAPNGVPTLSRWRKNRDNSISGRVSGSRNFEEGEQITTSPIRKGAISSGEVVTTGSGSRYFLG